MTSECRYPASATTRLWDPPSLSKLLPWWATSPRGHLHAPWWATSPRGVHAPHGPNGSSAHDDVYELVSEMLDEIPSASQNSAYTWQHESPTAEQLEPLETLET